ncbi:MAG: dihydrodipicolinate synthase family protein [Alphaproteobacteria bacterium]|nr:dihydrodipicolinate synthase family protein [Alphaproteobacteria bacterium]
MSAPQRFSGVLTPVITPFNEDLSPDSAKFIQQCRWMLSQNVGLSIFGTNSEANSLTVEEKLDLLDCLIDAGIDPLKLMPGTGCCALGDSVRMTAHAVKRGCGGVLMLPPFYYKGVSDEGLYRNFAEIIERVGSTDLRVYLYHIPPVAQVGLSHDLIERLVKAYPETVVGVKDSSGDWDNTEGMIKRGWDDFRVLAGSETFLLQNMRAGGAGCISATANVNPAAINTLYENWEAADADDQQAALDEIREVFQAFPMIPALKAASAHYSGVSSWATVRPPLVELTAAQSAELIANLKNRAFDMPGLAEAASA